MTYLKPKKVIFKDILQIRQSFPYSKWYVIYYNGILMQSISQQQTTTIHCPSHALEKKIIFFRVFRGFSHNYTLYSYIRYLWFNFILVLLLPSVFQERKTDSKISFVYFLRLLLIFMLKFFRMFNLNTKKDGI